MENLLSQKKEGFNYKLELAKEGIKVIVELIRDKLTNDKIKELEYLFSLLTKNYFQIKLENWYFFQCAISYYMISLFVPDEESDFEEIQRKKIISIFLLNNKITDDRIVGLKNDLNLDFDPFFELGFNFYESNGIAHEIDNYLEQIEDGLNSKYRYIESIDKVRLAFLFKFLSWLPYKRLLVIVRQRQDDLFELYNKTIVEKNSKKAPSVRDFIKKLKEDYFLNREYKQLNINNEELLELMIEFLSGILNLDVRDQISNYVYSCIRFKETNRKGTAAILYGLFRFIPYLKLPSYEVWFAIKNESAEMDDRNTWAQFQKRNIKKIMILR